MFTVEHDFTGSEIVILDRTQEHEDLQVHLFDDVVYLCQWCDIIEDYSVLIITPEMFELLIRAYNAPEGAYLTE
jgi:hypothetical protein